MPLDGLDPYGFSIWGWVDWGLGGVQSGLEVAAGVYDEITMVGGPIRDGIYWVAGHQQDYGDVYAVAGTATAMVTLATPQGAVKGGVKAGVKGVTKPPNLTPLGAGRHGAFNQAKRDLGIPTSQQPITQGLNYDKHGNIIPGRGYDFQDGKRIVDDSKGHTYPSCPEQNRGRHFNDGNHDRHYDY
jgi:hypothetical protein